MGMKSRIKLCGVIIAVMAIMMAVPTSVSAANGNVAAIGGTEYPTLAAAVDAASDNTETTITLINNIEMSTEDIVTIDEEKNIILDMNGKSITVKSGFNGRAIVNNGTLCITGNGTIDTSVSPVYGLGPLNNYGTLTIENGTFRGDEASKAACIWNREGGTAYFEGGTYENAVTLVRTALGSTTYISGGVYENDTYPAIENDGEMEITGGIFKNTSCSSCSPDWGYTIRSGNDGNPETHIVISGDVTVIGVQGAVSNVGGLMEINGGDFRTVACNTHGAETSYYALYVAGESGESKAIVRGGNFESAYREAAHVGNDNTGGDGGINEDATTEFMGGTFIAPKGQKAVTGAAATGNPIITGGNYSSDPQEYVADDVTEINYGNEFYIGEAASEVINNLKSGDKITVIKITGDLTVPEGVSVKNETGEDIIVNDQQIQTGEAQEAGHILEKISANEPTCTEEGNIEYYVCTICGEFYADSEGNNPITDHDAVVLGANGHDFENGICTICGAKEPSENPDDPTIDPDKPAVDPGQNGGQQGNGGADQNGEKPSAESDGASVTGDDFNMAAVIALMGMAAAAAAGIALYSRRKRSN